MVENKNNGTSASPSRAEIARGGLNSTATEQSEERFSADPATGAAAEALALAEEAEAEAAEAEALAAVARARAKAIRLRRQAQARTTEVPDGSVPDDGGEDETASVTATEVLPETSPDEQNTDADLEPPANEAPRWWRRRPDRRVWARVALGFTFVLICALLAASGYLVWHHRNAVAERHRTAEFAAAARQGVLSLMTMDFNHAKDDVQRLLDNSTGQFRDDFQSRADDFTKVVQESKVVTKATVNATAVQSMADSNSAVVLVSATSEVSNATGAQNQPRAWRLSVTVTRDGGQIKMSRVEFVP